MKALIISPQNWGKMRVSKHHYAIELASYGYDVYFLEPLSASWKISKTSFNLETSGIENLKLIQQEISFPYNLKFHFPEIYDKLVQKHIKILERHFGRFNLIWSFDIGDSIPLRHFHSRSKRVFFAADWPPSLKERRSCKSADIIISVAQEILEQYREVHSGPFMLVPHGVADCFIKSSKLPFQPKSEKIHIGMSGNFLRPDLDRQALLKIVRGNLDIVFELFGPTQTNDSNIGGELSYDTIGFIEELKKAPNVKLEGVVEPEELSQRLRKMDAFLVCYDVRKDQSKATNYHKISEYLVYQRMIISNEVSAHYKNPLVFQPRDSFGHVDVVSNFSTFANNYSRNIDYSLISVKTPPSYGDNLLSILKELEYKSASYRTQ